MAKRCKHCPDKKLDLFLELTTNGGTKNKM